MHEAAPTQSSPEAGSYSCLEVSTTREYNGHGFKIILHDVSVGPDNLRYITGELLLEDTTPITRIEFKLPESGECNPVAVCQKVLEDYIEKLHRQIFRIERTQAVAGVIAAASFLAASTMANINSGSIVENADEGKEVIDTIANIPVGVPLSITALCTLLVIVKGMHRSFLRYNLDRLAAPRD